MRRLTLDDRLIRHSSELAAREHKKRRIDRLRKALERPAPLPAAHYRFV